MHLVSTMRKIIVALLTVLFSVFQCFAQNWKMGDSFTQDGLTFKVVSHFLVTDPRDSVLNASTFYDSGELMVINVSDALTDVVIPVAIGRYKVIGLTDSLFYGKTFNRVWMPELEFIGNSSFENAKIESGTLVIHNVNQVGFKAFHNIDARLCFDINRTISYFIPKNEKNDSTSTADDSQILKQPKGGVVCHAKNIGKLSSSPYFGYEIAGQNWFFNKCVSDAYGGDQEWINRPLGIKHTDLRFCKRNFSTTPSGVKKGLDVRISVFFNKNAYRSIDGSFPWGRLTAEYGKLSYYSVYDKKKHTTVKYDYFKPQADPKLKEGWRLWLKNEEEEVVFSLKGKRIKK